MTTNAINNGYIARMNTPTPRTDAEVVFPSCNDGSDTSHPQGTHVDADFARALERELAIETERATHYRDEWQRVTAELAAARR